MTQIAIVLPTPYEAQKSLVYWRERNPKAHVLVAPCGTKVGKSFGSAIWLLREALLYSGLYCVWVAPTFMKSKVGFRYIKAMLPDIKAIKIVESRLEITLPNGSFIKFVHGHDAETTIEGEAVDRFVVDESGKQSEQLWYSLYTTISQTGGVGIITGTPRGHTWYFDLYKKALQGDPFFAHLTLKTADSPYTKKHIIEQAKKLLPIHLFKQYYEAAFIKASSVFSQLESIFTKDKLSPNKNYWIHPDPEKRKGEISHGWDIAKSVDYSVLISTNQDGELVGYWRFNKISYPRQVKRVFHYITKKFPEADNMLRYDKTGVGNAVCDLLADLDWDVSMTGVTYNNAIKQEMVSTLMVAMETNWLKSPYIPRLEHECSIYELRVTKSGLFTYNAPEGEHDDVVNALMLSVSGSYSMNDTKFDQLDDILNREKDEVSEMMSEAAAVFSGEDADDDLLEDDEDDEIDDIPDDEDDDNDDTYDYDSEMY